MAYLPPGWTEERLAAATYGELATLPYDTLHLISPASITSTEAQDLIFGARIDERIRRERARLGLPAIPPRFQPGVEDPETDPVIRDVTAERNRRFLARERERFVADPSAPVVPDDADAQLLPGDPVVRVVEEARYDDFGFVLVRLDYDDEPAWARWSDAFDQELDRGVADAEGGERVADKLLTSMVEDPDLDGTGLHGAVSYCKDLRLNDMVKPGLDTSMVLVVDRQAMDSLLSPRPPGQEPFVWAVDMGFPFAIGDQLPRGDPPTARYPGYFRVTPYAAISELWPLLKRGMPGRSLWDPDVRVWTGL